MEKKSKNNKIADLMVNESKIIETEAKQIQQEAVNLKALAAHLESNTNIEEDLPFIMRVNILLFKIRKYIWLSFVGITITIILLLVKESNAKEYLLKQVNTTKEENINLMEKIDVKDNEIADLYETLEKVEDTFEALVKENIRLNDDCRGLPTKDPIIVDRTNSNPSNKELSEVYKKKLEEFREARRQKLEKSSVPKEKRERRKLEKQYSKNALIF